MTTARHITLSTLSPVHIGCGEAFEPSGFVIHDGLLHVFDPADLADALSDGERRKLAAIADQREPIGALQRYFRDRAADFAALARQQVAVSPAIASEYAQKAGQPTQRGAAGEATYNLFPIERTSYRPLDCSPYLPGSSLKGSMRTAWLNQLAAGGPFMSEEKDDRPGAARSMEQRLLGYAANRFENDPFRLLAVADAHPEDDGLPPPTRVVYSISKKKRALREGERVSELKVFLETIPEALPAAFFGELRFASRASFAWSSLCDACNAFYRPQLIAELQHPVLGGMLDQRWKVLITSLLDDEVGQLIAARQGFLLRVGRHSGAESVTLDGVRRIKILGARVAGRQKFDFRAQSTEKRYASLTRTSNQGLLPFGWVWVDASDDEHRHLSAELRHKLDLRSRPLREAHDDRLLRLAAQQQERAAAASERQRQAREREEAARAEEQARHDRERALSEMPANRRRVAEFIADFEARSEQLRGQRENANAVYHGKARQLARDAAGWDADERRAAADAIELWLPKVVRVEIKDERKKLKLASLRMP